MNRRALLISGASTVAGLGLLRLHLSRAEQRLAGGAPTRVLVVRSDQRGGSRLTRETLGTRDLPEAYLESRHIPASKRSEVLDARLGVDVRAGETLLWTDLAGLRPRQRQLAQLVPEGMRAFPVAARGLDRLVHPGDRVDVLAAPAARGTRPEGSDVRAIAQNVLVLAVGENLGDDAAAGSTRGGRITLSVTPEQGKRLTAAEIDHELRLSLRNPDDLALHEEGSGAAAIVAGRAER